MSHGFSATTVDAVLARASASKGAFFHHFPTKGALGVALVERYASEDGRALEEAFVRAEAITDDPLDQLIALLRGFEDGAASLLEIQPSCLFVSFIYESELSTPGTDALILDSILHWRSRILDKLKLAAATRPRLAEVDLESLADQVFTVFEGGFLLARALDTPAALGRQLAHVRHYLELLGS